MRGNVGLMLLVCLQLQCSEDRDHRGQAWIRSPGLLNHQSSVDETDVGPVHPDMSSPDAAVPDLPVPDLPVPDLPIPDLPVPALPVPDLPVPDQPVPDLVPPVDLLPGEPVPDLYYFPDMPLPDLGPDRGPSTDWRPWPDRAVSVDKLLLPGTCGPPEGCDCGIGSSAPGGCVPVLALLGLLWWRRRR